MSTAYPAWLDRSLYPFDGRTHAAGAGAMHYLDEGAGAPVVFVHGTPSWSFVWRHLVLAFRDRYRCVAPDHLGFGLSDKPEDAEYTPAAHARRLAGLIDALDLRDVTLVVHDFGGPIGLSYALERPENVRRVVILNTWMWSNAGNRPAELASGLLGSPVGRFLYRQLNVSARFLLPSAYGDRAKLTPEIHRHYLEPFAAPAQRQAPWVLARELTGSNAFYDGLWERRRALQDTPALVVWGMRDRLIGPAQLERWREALPHARVVRLEQAGHFVQEEAPEELAANMRPFLAGESDEAVEGAPDGAAPHEPPSA